MAASLTPAQDAQNAEKTATPDMKSSSKTGFFGRKKGLQEIVPGWIPLKKTKQPSPSSSTAPTSEDDKRDEIMDSKNYLEGMDTHGSAGYGVGEVEALREVRSDNELLEDEEGDRNVGDNGEPIYGNTESGESSVVYKVYKRRWFGLVQLVLLNIVVSWDVSYPPKAPINICSLEDTAGKSFE